MHLLRNPYKGERMGGKKNSKENNYFTNNIIEPPFRERLKGQEDKILEKWLSPCSDDFVVQKVYLRSE